MSRIIYAEPVSDVVGRMRVAAAVLRVDGRDDGRADLLERYAVDLEEAIRIGGDVEWVDSAAVAEFERVSLAAIQARCRRTLRKKGLARKRVGGRWEISRTVIDEQPLAA